MVRGSGARWVTPLLLATQLVCGAAWGTEYQNIAGSQTSIRHLMKDAVHVRITPRGQKFFDTNLSKILGNLGVNLDEGYFPSQSFSAAKPIDINAYKDSNPEAVQMFLQVRDMLTKWFVGFSLNDPRPAIQIGESGYAAKFSRFGIVTDTDLMSRLGKRDGAVLAIELEIQKLDLQTQAVTAWDMNNEVLGKVGLQDVKLQVGSEKNPVKLRLPFYIHMNNQGGLDFEALEISENLDQADISLQYKKLLLPQIAVSINGKSYTLSTPEVDKMLSDRLPDVLNGLRSYLGDFAHKQLPDLLNQKAKQYLAGSLEQVQSMAAPGAEQNDKRPDFKWGLVLSGIHLNQSLNIDLSAFAEDPLNPEIPLVGSDLSRGAPALNDLATDKYDVALSLDRGIINRILRLSFLRNNFAHISLDSGEPLTLMMPPTIDYVRTSQQAGAQETYLKLHVAVENQPGSSFLKDTIVLQFDIIAKLRQLKDKSGMQMVLSSIDTDSLYLDPRYLSLLGKIVPGKVRSGIQDKLKEMSAKWQREEKVIPGTLPIPPQFLGIQLEVTCLLMDPTGNLVMYLSYPQQAAIKSAAGASK